MFAVLAAIVIVNAIHSHKPPLDTAQRMVVTDPSAPGYRNPQRLASALVNTLAIDSQWQHGYRGTCALPGLHTPDFFCDITLKGMWHSLRRIDTIVYVTVPASGKSYTVVKTIGPIRVPIGKAG